MLLIRILMIGLVLAPGLSSEISFGCAVCGFGEEETRQAFILTTGIMTIVPLAAIGSIVFYIYRKMTHNSKNVQKES